ncbi:hypothetical protein HanPSC8_Chr11g0464151 [Helianthus annuus]|nr:hypothetical protein HanPSC8_Chr11g0464151 [Helianthus annuus]
MCRYSMARRISATLFTKPLRGLPLSQHVQIATRAKLHYQTRELIRLKMRIQSRKKRVIQTLKYFPFGFRS